MIAQVEVVNNEVVIVEKYIPLVKHIAGKVILGKSKYIEYEDLVGYGMLGLMDAYKKFKPEKGMKFSTYASIRIKGSMIDEMRRSSPISKGAMDKLNKYNQAMDALQRRLLREPTTQEIGIELGINNKGVSEIERYINYISMMSLDSMIYSDDDFSITHILEDESSPRPEIIVEANEEIDILAKCLDKLNEKDKLVLNLYYYEELTLKSIGQILIVSESRVCQLHARAIVNLRKVMKEEKYI
ncbi:FliA/WhiG family RNA polymerase sigma factor [uncultured Clostridium sp.]|jgi:RNA polymerase sigma factor for flagellar operon FliA|uniref:FliA/WhiG family RNA polymerase sigma factor n=1 Tax=uncultured Clostridium sp. TaxID=59620 RepID=UPI002628506A|nr:FliA/WhiG family RNA polymerase sigma factor [uncultured Clostridium sp.]